MLQSLVLIDNYMNRLNKPDLNVTHTLSISASVLHVARRFKSCRDEYCITITRVFGNACIALRLPHYLEHP